MPKILRRVRELAPRATVPGRGQRVAIERGLETGESTWP
jgi:hypothetical protein